MDIKDLRPFLIATAFLVLLYFAVHISYQFILIALASILVWKLASMRLGHRGLINVGRVIVLVLMLALWQYLAPLINNYFFYSSFTQTISNFHKLFMPYLGSKVDFPNYPQGIVPAMSLTFYEILVAFVVASLSGIFAGLALGYFKLVGNAYEPIVYILYAIPAPILYPVFILILGIDPVSRIAIAIWLAIFPPMIIVASGVRRTKQNHVRLAKSFGAGNGQIFRKVIIPSSTGAIISGIRLSMVFSIIGVIFAEVIASKEGLGSIISIAESEYAPAVTFGAIVIITLFVTAILIALYFIERRLMPYER